MSISRILPSALVAALLALPSGAIGQETTPAETEIALGETYVVETFSDWQLICEKTENGADTCRIVQSIANDKGSTMARISIRNYTDPSKGIAAGATVTVPLETALSEGLKMQIDDNPPKQYPFAYCNRVGCHALLGFTLEEMTWLRNGKSATLATLPFAAESKPVLMELSLTGVTAAYNALLDQELANLSKQ